MKILDPSFAIDTISKYDDFQLKNIMYHTCESRVKQKWGGGGGGRG